MVNNKEVWQYATSCDVVAVPFEQGGLTPLAPLAPPPPVPTPLRLVYYNNWIQCSA